MYELIQSIHNTVQSNKVYNLGKATSFNINDNNKNQTIGKQLQYYRRIVNLRAKDMAKDLNIGYNTIWRLEEKSDSEYRWNQKSIKIVNKIIDYLQIRDKLDYSQNEYADFILNKKEEVIKELLNIYSRKELAKKLDVTPDTITRWIKGKNIISKDAYYKIKKVLEIK